MKKFSISVILMMTYVLCLSQPQIQKIIPLSPNAAAIEKYGEMPVGYFTGIPSVSVPIYTIQSKSFSLPLTLGYHAGGNKVEDLASWVGLGWSISAIPSISRKVNGIPDEAVHGYLNKYKGLYSAKKMYDSVMLFGGVGTGSDYIQSLYSGEVDTEADIYSFNLIGKSGKFFWSQEAERYFVTPWQNIKIEGSGSTFTITDDDGTIYQFNTADVSYPSGQSIANSWFINSISNANRTDNLVFNYTGTNLITKSLNQQSKLIWGSDCGSSPSSISTSSLFSNDISTIYFDGGRIEFNRGQGRQDLNGGYSLNSIKVYNSENVAIKELLFNYFYVGAGNDFEGKRLMLNDVKVKEPEGYNYQQYRFLYDSTIEIPSRLSYARDYWGFYNRQTSNMELAPTAQVTIMGNSVVSSGANRDVNPNAAQFAILKRVYYPTGGYSDFEYESNTAYNPSFGLPQSGLQENSASLYADFEPPISSYYSTTFQINNPSQGGANVTVQAGGMTCMSCSNLRIVGLDYGVNSHIWIAVSGNAVHYLPNGNYEMVADFGSQDPEDFMDFHFMTGWQTENTTTQPPNSTNVGGLRIKALKSYDGAGNKLIKSYRYTNSLSSDVSSGNIFAQPFLLGFEDFTCIDYNSGGYTDRYSYRVAASPAATGVSHSGSVAGYATVYEFVDSAGVTGVNEYKFSHASDMIDPNSPFPPSYSMEVSRGQLLEHNVFRKQANGFFPVKRTSIEYTSKTFDSLASFSFKTRLKREPVVGNGISSQLPQFEHTTYENIPQWAQQSQKTEIVYDANDTTKSVATTTQYTYHNTLYQLAQSTFANSKNDNIQVKKYYAPDIFLSGTAEIARQILMSQNNIVTVLKEQVYQNDVLINEIRTDYKKIGNSIMPGEIFQKIGAGPLELKVKFGDYSIRDNILEQQKTNDVKEVYLWGYQSQYPVVKIIGSDLATVLSIAALDTAVLNNGTPAQKQAQLTLISNYFSTNPLVQLFTYTYKPLVGVTSETDPTGRTIYYEYDTFNRLKLQKDEQGNILKKYCYNYAGQVINCQ